MVIFAASGCLSSLPDRFLSPSVFLWLRAASQLVIVLLQLFCRAALILAACRRFFVGGPLSRGFVMWMPTTAVPSLRTSIVTCTSCRLLCNVFLLFDSPLFAAAAWRSRSWPRMCLSLKTLFLLVGPLSTP